MRCYGQSDNGQYVMMRKYFTHVQCQFLRRAVWCHICNVKARHSCHYLRPMIYSASVSRARRAYLATTSSFSTLTTGAAATEILSIFNVCLRLHLVDMYEWNKPSRQTFQCRFLTLEMFDVIGFWYFMLKRPLEIEIVSTIAYESKKMWLRLRARIKVNVSSEYPKHPSILNELYNEIYVNPTKLPRYGCT